jgi:folate-dependent phosphoribosylglycinamide formyltransferase PurN
MAIVGSHSRNIALLEKARILEGVEIVGLVLYERDDGNPQPPLDLSEDLKKVWNLHFKRRAIAERKFFPSYKVDDIVKLQPTKVVKNQLQLNVEDIVSFVSSLKPDLCLISGVPIIKGELLKSLPAYAVNLHMGLIPEYKGSITMFWPFYMLEPEMAGCTYHVIGPKVDTGMLLHQVGYQLTLGDGMHDAASRCLSMAHAELAKVIKHIANEISKNSYPIFDSKLESTGKLFKKEEFTAAKLQVIYNLYEDKIVDMAISGKIKSRKPNLIRINE